MVASNIQKSFKHWVIGYSKEKKLTTRGHLNVLYSALQFTKLLFNCFCSNFMKGSKATPKARFVFIGYFVIFIFGTFLVISFFSLPGIIPLELFLLIC